MKNTEYLERIIHNFHFCIILHLTGKLRHSVSHFCSIIKTLTVKQRIFTPRFVLSPKRGTRMGIEPTTATIKARTYPHFTFNTIYSKI